MPPSPSAPRPFGLLDIIMLGTAFLAMVAGAAGWGTAFTLLKPLPMITGIVLVWTAGLADGRMRAILLVGAVGGLAGDVFLMWPELFLFGLVAFLIGHLAYVAAFLRGVPVLPSKMALVALLVVGGGFYLLVLLPRLDPGLVVPVALYATVICTMAAQAVGRHGLLRRSDSALVALGALTFVVSDLLLATNRFAQPLPLSHVWVLGTYFPAQWMILRGMTGGLPGRGGAA